jgi:hypothetical protein
MTKSMIGKIMFKPTTIKAVMSKLMIIKIIMKKPTKNLKQLWQNNHD